MCKCKKGCCNCGNNSSSSQNNSSESKLENVYNTLPGHPILMIDEESDIICFDTTTGKGSGIWDGWAIMDGKTHYDLNNGNKAIVCFNMQNRVPVQAGDAYGVGDIFGLDAVALTAAQNGAHTHVLTDPGHTHGITDPGHTHGITDPEHTHTVANTSHTHAFTTGSDGAHGHSIVVANQATADRSGGETATAELGDATLYTSTDGAHTHTGTTDAAEVAMTINPAVTGVTVNSDTTDVVVVEAESGVAIAESGAGEEHENRQPSYALLFIKRIYVPV